MNEDKAREEFEAFAKNHDVWLYRDAAGEYEFAVTRLLYKTWLAALAYQDDLIRAAYADASEVCFGLQRGEFNHDWNCCTLDCARAIECRTPADARRKFEEIGNE